MLNNSLGKLPFIVHDFKTKKIISILGNRHQSTICSHFFRHSKEKARNSMQIVMLDKSKPYILLMEVLFSKTKMLLNHFHIVQHMNHALQLTMFKNFETRFEHAKREDELRLLSCLAINHPLQLIMRQ